MYVDTTIFMYAMGSESRYKDPCARILRAGAADKAVLVTSAETLQEVLHRYRSIGRHQDIRAVFDAISASVQRVLPVTAEDVEEARRLGERTVRRIGGLRARSGPRRGGPTPRPSRDTHGGRGFRLDPRGGHRRSPGVGGYGLGGC